MTHICFQVAHKQQVTKIGIKNAWTDIKAQKRSIFSNQEDNGGLLRKDEV